MSSEDLKKYKPDEAKEFSFFGTAIVSLASALSAAFVAADHPTWTYITIGLCWVGHTVEKYFQLHEKKSEGEEPKP